MKLLSVPLTPQEDILLFGVPLRRWRGFVGIAFGVALVQLVVTALLWRDYFFGYALSDGPDKPAGPVLECVIAILNLPVVFYYMVFPREIFTDSATQVHTFDYAVTVGLGPMPSFPQITWALLLGCAVSLAFYRKSFFAVSRPA